jgi:hypothetical protein
MEEVSQIALKMLYAYQGYCNATKKCTFFGNSAEIFKAVFRGDISWVYNSKFGEAGCNAQYMTCGEGMSDYSGNQRLDGAITHEFGHMFDNRITGEEGYARSLLLYMEPVIVDGQKVFGGRDPGTGDYHRTTLGYVANDLPYMQHPIYFGTVGICGDMSFKLGKGFVRSRPIRRGAF